MKAIFVYKYLSLGGVESVLRTRLRHLPHFGIDARCWFLHDVGGRSVFEGLEDRIQVGTIPELIRFVRDRKIDVVISIDTDEILAEYEAASDLPPLVLEAHSAYANTLDRWRHLGNRTRAVFAPSAYHGEVIADILGHRSRVRVLPNVVGNRFLSSLSEVPCPPPDPVVGWLGRLDDHKNWKLLIDVAEDLCRSPGPPEIWLVGRPVAARTVADLYRRAKQARILPRLRWLDGVGHSRIPALLDQIRASGGVTLTTSRAESFGMTVVEAMARACPVVVPDQGPFTELVKDGESGLCYEPGSRHDAVHAIERLLADRELRERLGQAARIRVRANYSARTCTGLLAQELRGLFEPETGEAGPSGRPGASGGSKVLSA